MGQISRAGIFRYLESRTTNGLFSMKNLPRITTCFLTQKLWKCLITQQLFGKQSCRINSTFPVNWIKCVSLLRCLSHYNSSNITGFFLTLTRRESDVPLSTQYLKSTKDLESKKYLVPTSMKSKLLKEGGVSLINYVQSDCNTPSDRDHFVQMLQRHMKVDSYGTCEHNKDLPKQ